MALKLILGSKKLGQCHRLWKVKHGVSERKQRFCHRERWIAEGKYPPLKDDTTNVQVKIAKLTDIQRVIFERIQSGTINDQVNDQVNVPNLAILFGVSEKTIRRDLYVLRDMNLIHYVGSDKTGHSKSLADCKSPQPSGTNCKVQGCRLSLQFWSF